MLLGLGHNAVGSGYNQDRTIHLCGAGDHILNIVGMSRAIYVSVVTLLSLILNVSGRDGNTTLSLLGSLVDVLKSLHLVTSDALCKNGSDSSRKSGLTMIDMTDGTDVYVRLGAVKMLFCHCEIPP